MLVTVLTSRLAVPLMVSLFPETIQSNPVPSKPITSAEVAPPPNS